VLRPLGLGEILDRAVTLCVRHFALFSLIFIVYAIPVAVFQYLGTGDQSKVFGTLTDVVQAQAAGKHVDSNDVMKALAQSSVTNGWTALWIFSALFIAPFPAAALIDAAATFYLGGSTSFGQAYRFALGRWLPLVGVNILYLVCGLALYVGVFLIALVVALALVFLYKASAAVGIGLSILLGAAFFLVLIGFVLVAALAIQVSYFSCVVEKMPFVTAFSRGISRVFVGAGLRRSLLVGLAYFAIFIGIWLVTVTGESVLYGLLRSNIAGTVYETLVRVATAAFLTAFIAIFYFDLRVRTEGFDLQLAASGDPRAVS
jgi:hypothetical protein